tara:strand:- start:11320 stop:14247 length:2928 start_codon:yes stop_codon:yes gene_type:complete
MSIKSFKFVSPGVFINEIDNSFIPKSADEIGPVVIGRSRRGLAMQPVKVESFSDFVTMFGDTVPGGGGGDVYRDGNYQSPMYGTYAAKAFLRANVAPVTYIRLLGQQDSNATSAGVAGWKTTKNASTTVSLGENGGAFGLWLFSSSSLSGSASGSASTNGSIGTGSLAAIWYIDKSASIQLTGALAGLAGAGSVTGSGFGQLINNDSSYNYTVVVSSSINGAKNVTFGFDDTSETFIRKAFNTNPQLTQAGGTFYPSASAKGYWLGETFEQEIRDASLVSAAAFGVILPIHKSGTVGTGPQKMQQASREAVAGWFIGQDLGATGSYNPELSQPLFRLKGRGHGEWLHKNVKVSIEKIRKSTSTTTDYGTFSVVLRRLSDTDSKVEVMERFDNCTLDPTSPYFVGRKIGDKYTSWDTTNRILKTYGEYPNNSQFVYVEMNADVEAGATDPLYLPFGYFGPPRFRTLINLSQSTPQSASFIGQRCSGSIKPAGTQGPWFLYGSNNQGLNAITGALSFPSVRLRVSASDGGLTDATKAYFGMQNTRTTSSTRSDRSVGDFHRLLYADFPDDPTGVGSGAPTKYPSSHAGVEAYAYVFSMNDISASAAGAYSYQSGSRRKVGNHVGAVTDTTLLNAGYDSFTAPFWGGFDGWDITLPDPLYNLGIGSAAENTTSSPYYTYKRAIDTVGDSEFVDMNLLVAPGLTHDGLTGHMIDVCEERADALALIDLSSVYIPSHEKYYSDKSSRIGTTPVAAASSLRDRIIDSSYGCTFYPWVQTRDDSTGQLLWVPPSVVMVGVLASSQAKTDVWFAPAGFNRGGLTDGAAGIPVTGVTERLTSKNRDTLYESNINPIASFPSSGIVVFGQKTLQERQSALDRINVRRLVIYLKKQISILSTQILFEQNVQATWNRFKSLVEPFLTNVKTRFGITEYRLILDESTTTPDLIDQNILYAKIMIKPARAIEFIAIDFVIASTGASFDD